MKYQKRSFLVAFKDETKDDKMKSSTTTTTTTEVWTQTLLNIYLWKTETSKILKK